MIPKDNKGKNLLNMKFNMLEVIDFAGTDKFKNNIWLCKCECGNTKKVLASHLISGHTKSCGCLQKQSFKFAIHKPKHNMIHTRLYKIWNGMKNRTNKNSSLVKTEYKNYSGRDITICDEWAKDFVAFYNWAMSNGYQDNLTIDRIDVNGNYEPSNCRWVTMKEQQNNKRNNTVIEYNGEKNTISQWTKKLGYSKGLLTNRLIRGWSIERALNTPKTR